MPESKLIVLKFGGSVLLDEQRLRIAVHEIYRWRRAGWRVVAVVSALAGRTNELLDRAETLAQDSSDLSKASLLASGENESASLLGIHLDRAGVPAMVLSPASIQLVASGGPLDANPISIDRSTIFRALDEAGVVVIPGFVAINESGATVTLGRGGSDLTAIFLAHSLNADRCRLIKNVDGLYESDPADTIVQPKRYAYANYVQALHTDGSIIQIKAIELAKFHHVEFELCTFNSVSPTCIGSSKTVYSQCAHPLEPTSISLIGLGTVGRGVLDLVNQLPELFTIKGAACRSPHKHLDLKNTVEFISDDPITLASSGSDVVIELIGGIETASQIVNAALESGSHVIHANKALEAQRGQEIAQRAKRANRRVLCSASVGGAAPILEAITALCQQSSSSKQIRSIRGVLNGTGNFVLSSIAAGATLEESIITAQQLGFAEADPSRDLDGRDSLDKLMIIAHRLGWYPDDRQVRLDSISDWFKRGGSRDPVRHIARLSPEAASVCVEEIDQSDPDEPLGKLENEWNAAVMEFDDGSTQVIKGKGAGRWPTSESVLADLLELRRSFVRAARRGEDE